MYVARPAEMDAVIRGRPLKALDCEKLGLEQDLDVLFAFDKAKRMLVVCSSIKLARSRSHCPKIAVLTYEYQ